MTQDKFEAIQTLYFLVGTYDLYVYKHPNTHPLRFLLHCSPTTKKKLSPAIFSGDGELTINGITIELKVNLVSKSNCVTFTNYVENLDTTRGE